MINKFLKFIFCFYRNIIFEYSKAAEFKFNVTEIDITENGNLIVGSKNGKLKLMMGMR